MFYFFLLVTRLTHTDMANEAIDTWHRLNSSTKHLQLSLVLSSHCGRERIWKAKGKVAKAHET